MFFIEKVRSVHGENVNILWVVGMMRSENSNVNNWMKEILASLGGEQEGLYTVTVTQNNEGAVALERSSMPRRSTTTTSAIWK